MTIQVPIDNPGIGEWTLVDTNAITSTDPGSGRWQINGTRTRIDISNADLTGLDASSGTLASLTSGSQLIFRSGGLSTRYRITGATQRTNYVEFAVVAESSSVGFALAISDTHSLQLVPSPSSTAPEGTDVLSTNVTAAWTLQANGDGTSSWQPPGAVEAHSLGGASHQADTLANLNSKISDATLDDASSPRPPTDHGHTSDEVANDSLTVGGATVTAALEAVDAHGQTIGNPHGTTLQAILQAATSDNDVNIPAGAPVILRDGAVSGTVPLTVRKENAVGGIAGIRVLHQDLDGGLDVEQISSGRLTRISPQGVNADGSTLDSAGLDFPGAGDIEAGAGNPLDVGTDAAKTSEVNVGGPAIATNVGGNANVAGALSVVGTVNGVDVAALESDFLDHSARHQAGGGDALVVQQLSSGGAASGQLLETTVGGWTLVSKSSIDHNLLTNYAPAEHIDWSTPGVEQIDASRYASGTGGATNTVTGTAPLENAGDNVNANLAFADQLEATLLGRAAGAGTGAPSFLDAAAVRTLLNVEDGATGDRTAGEIEGIVNHDNLLGFEANEHIDWTTDAGGPTVDPANLPAASTAAAGIVELAADSEDNAALAVNASDPRLSDDRNPLPHTHAPNEIDDLPSGTILGRQTAGIGPAAALGAVAVRSILQLGTSALLNAGTDPFNVVQLNASGQLPGLDASNLTNLPSGDVTVFGTPATGEYARWTDENTIEGRTALETIGDLGLDTRYYTQTLADSTFQKKTYIQTADPSIADGAVDGDFWIEMP